MLLTKGTYKWGTKPNIQAKEKTLKQSAFGVKQFPFHELHQLHDGTENIKNNQKIFKI